MNNVYEGTLTGTVTNGVFDVVVSRVADHACRCDECKVLDEVDAKEMELAKRFLMMEIDYNEFRLAHVELYSTTSPRLFAFQKNFDTGAVSLQDAIEGLMAQRSENDPVLELFSVPAGRFGAPMSEDNFRCMLDGLLYGYEIRMRTVHRWTKGKA